MLRNFAQLPITYPLSCLQKLAGIGRHLTYVAPRQTQPCGNTGLQASANQAEPTPQTLEGL